jgi:arylsulfatase A-like enzyme
MNRRSFLHAAAASFAAPLLAHAEALRPTPPNIILMMADDLGYGDVGFNGNSEIHTPHLDQLCLEGLRFERFYAGGPVCSPTRATCLTGRHYLRYGITNANEGRLRAEETTVAEMCRSAGYRTGHFGKWHLGTLTKTEKDGNRGGAENAALYAPPWEHGFETCFSTEALVPTWDPALTPAENDDQWGTPGAPWRCAYWSEQGSRVTENMAGDDSRVIMDRVLPFVGASAMAHLPFLAVIWFHAPHAPVVGGEAHRAQYADLPEPIQHHHACITAMDEQVGRLRALLRETGQEENTLLFFASDNGPEGRGDGALTHRNHGSTGELRGRKRSLFEGGIRVPAFVKWPAVVRAGTSSGMPCSTLDYLPTVAGILGGTSASALPVDGISLQPLMRRETETRPKPIPFFFQDTQEHMFGSPTFGLIDNGHKLLTHLAEDPSQDLCFDLRQDPHEQRNIISQVPEMAGAMRAQLEAFLTSCRDSHAGRDYEEPFAPFQPFSEPLRGWSV